MPTRLDPLGPTGAPDAIVEFTTGSGTWTPDIVPCWVRATLVGGGAQGASGSTSSATPNRGGGAGATVQQWVRVTGPVPYAIGVAGTGSNNGGATTFGALMAPGGYSPTNGAWGGGYDSAGPTIMGVGQGLHGGAGGGTGTAKTAGRAPGLPFQANSATVPLGGGTAGADSGGHIGGSGGGSTPYGKGGAGGAANSAGAGAPGSAGAGYGAGGGGGGAGSSAGGAGGAGVDGYIVLEVYVETVA